MVNVDVYTINGEEYYLLEEITVNGISYLYLSKVDDEAAVMFRKRDKNDRDVLLPLDDENEVRKVALVFASKMLDA